MEEFPDGLNKVTKVYLLFTIIIQRFKANGVCMSKLAKAADADRAKL